MAIAYYTVASDTLQLPNGRISRRSDVVALEATNTRVVALVAAKLLVATTTMTGVTPPRQATAVVTGQLKGELIRPLDSENLYNLVSPEELKTHVPSVAASLVATSA